MFALHLAVCFVQTSCTLSYSLFYSFHSLIVSLYFVAFTPTLCLWPVAFSSPIDLLFSSLVDINKIILSYLIYYVHQLSYILFHGRVASSIRDFTCTNTAFFKFYHLIVIICSCRLSQIKLHRHLKKVHNNMVRHVANYRLCMSTFSKHIHWQVWLLF